MSFSLQNTTAPRVQCETWLSDISNTGVSLVGVAHRAKCCNNSGSYSEFMKPDSVTSAKGVCRRIWKKRNQRPSAFLKRLKLEVQAVRGTHWAHSSYCRTLFSWSYFTNSFIPFCGYNFWTTCRQSRYASPVHVETSFRRKFFPSSEFPDSQIIRSLLFCWTVWPCLCCTVRAHVIWDLTAYRKLQRGLSQIIFFGG
jgi:hypothetical protein